MRLFILIQLLNVAYGCVDFWKKWTGYRCINSKDINSETRCYMTEKLSYAQIIRSYFYVFCKNETIYGQLMRCLEAESTNHVYINDCYMSEFDVGQFVSGVKVIDVLVNLESTVMNNFVSATFNDIPTLRTITLTGLRTSGVLNVTFENVSSVAYLNIENYEFGTFMPRPFQNLSSLLTLSLKNGVLETLPSQVFQGLYNLNILNLSNNQIEEIDPLLLKNLTELQVLDLSGNKLINLPSDLLSDLSNLISFFVQENRLTALPDNLFAACPKLEVFSVSYNQIGRFPPGFFAGLRNLKHFAAINCSLMHLEIGIFSDATNLTGVFLTTNEIVNLPPDLFKNSKNLEKLYIGVNKIQDLPPGIFDDLINLQYIQLTFNRLQTLPTNVFQNLSSLEVLELGFNRLTHLPEDVFLPLINLRVLDISHSSFLRLSVKQPFGRSKHLTKISAKFSNFLAWPMINWTEHSLTSVDFSRSNFSNFDLMRLFILIQLLNVAYGCVDFWKKWTGYRCINSKDINSETRCYMTEKLSYAQIIRSYFYVFCKNETIYGQLMRCLEAESTNHVYINDCYMSEFDVGQFVSGVKVIDVLVNLESTVMNNFVSATFNDIPTLRTITLTGLRTSGVLNVTFENVSSVAYLNIENYEFGTFMPRPFQNLSSLLTLSLKNGVLETLPSQVFQGLYNLNILNLSNNQMEEIDPLLLKNLTELQVLDLSGNKLINLPSDLLSDLSNLISFFVQENRLTALPDNLFAACPKLEVFSVSYNQIGRFPPGFFAGLRNLKHFAAINCSLMHLEIGIFSDATNLTGVFLTTNEIVNLPPDLFKNSKNLEKLYIGVNKIQDLPPGIFDDLINFQYIQLTFNRLQTLPTNVFQNLSSLEVLELGFNRLTHLPEDVFLPLINLRVLDISHSSFLRLSVKQPFGRSKHLTKISAKFSNFLAWPMINWTEHSLTSVDFSRSNFSNVTLSLHTPNRAIVDLSESNIRTIYIDTREYGSNFITYDLRNSKIICDCNLRQFVDFLNVNLLTASKIFPNLTNLECYEEKKKLLDITTTYRMCPVTKDCPVHCECFQDFEGVLVNCSRKDMRDMPEILIENATVVDLTHNKISNVDPLLCRNVTHLYLSDNSLTSIDNLPPTLTYLSLNRNQLTRLPSSLMYRIDKWNELKILLAGNNWSCGCDSLFTKDWLIRNKHKILDFANVSCMSGSDLSSFVQVISTDKCKEEVIYFASWKTALVCISLIVFVLVLLIVLIVNVRRLKRTINNSENELHNAVAIYFINGQEENVEVR
ncbi:toll-like receptor 13 [Centruroides sculpturatus]|uniref:toll-like receptor 13 n=1 Tax=Centruroides sculpturatus TaxID=218467 RepID=UPI000C6D6DCA|nr:toll-like receptor 13 [Centruroides sculpturatus]